jgi:hypothetical protein
MYANEIILIKFLLVFKSFAALYEDKISTSCAFEDISDDRVVQVLNGIFEDLGWQGHVQMQREFMSEAWYIAYMHGKEIYLGYGVRSSRREFPVKFNQMLHL